MTDLTRLEQEGRIAELVQTCQERAHRYLNPAQGVPTPRDEYFATLNLQVAARNLRVNAVAPYGVSGIFEGDVLRVFSQLARLLLPGPEALATATEGLAIIRAGRAHDTDVAEMLALRAEIALDAAPLRDALAFAWEAVAAADDVCFHDLADVVVDAAYARAIREDVTTPGWDDVLRGPQCVRYRGHIHLLDISNRSGEWAPIDVVDRNEPSESVPGRPVGAVIEPRRWPPPPPEPNDPRLKPGA